MMRIFDTAKGEIAPLDLDAPNAEIPVKIYVCGITPYDSTHLGHAATYLTYDLLIRRLEDLGYTVELVRNITDVDDSILPKARELGVNFLDLAAKEIKRFRGDMAALETRPAAHEPRATESIPQMLDLIAALKERGHTYEVDGITWFDVSTDPNFGEVSSYDESTMIEFAGERGGTPNDVRQRNPLDFILWQPAADDEPSWPSPFGAGRPGWHVECSAMSWGYFGSTIDIHGGGSDLIFPHHECERAQSESGYGEQFVKHWMHTGMVAYEGTKMSKSLGNLVFVDELVRTHSPQAVRLALLGQHYRSDWEWFDRYIDDAQDLFERMCTAVAKSVGPDPEPTLAALRAALDDDLDGPRCRTLLEALTDGILAGEGSHPSAGEGLRSAAQLLGITIPEGSA